MKNLIILFSILAIVGSVKAQSIYFETVSVAGDGNNQLSWTIGESMTSTFSSDDYILTQGLHQGSYIITSVKANKSSNIKLSIYPNPFTVNFNINISEISDNFRFEIITITGQVIASNKITSNITNINMSQFTASNYILNVYTENNIISTFKIIKQ